jgi:putative colanic acid biosynthesis acetyltransferase WcaF
MLANLGDIPPAVDGGPVSASGSIRSLAAARRAHSYDKGRGFLAQALWVATSELIFTKVWCPNRLRCAILRWFGAHIGAGVLIRHRVRVQWPWKLSIGDNSWVGTDTELYNLDDIVIGADVVISQRVYLCTGSHDRWSPTFAFDNGPIVIEAGAWVCARSTVLRGVTIGANSVVGATSLVTTDVPADSTVRPPRSTIAPTVTRI